MFTNIPNEFWEIVSYTMGCSSVLIWLGAQMPQIIKNWRKKSVEGLSPLFLVAWVAGDTSNLVGCLLTGQLGVQILLASYFCVVDVILITQFNLYKAKPTVVDGFDPYATRDDFETNDNSNHVRKLRANSMVDALKDKLALVWGVGTLSRRVSAAPIASSDEYTGNFFSQDLGVAFGYIVAYFSMCMYLTSRLPQIYHNYQRKSTTGVSMLLFVFALMGNTTYVLSILLSPQSIGHGAKPREFLVREMSYLIGAFGTIIFDCVILYQWRIYSQTKHRRRSTAPLDRISRPYLGISTRGPTLPVQCITPAIRPSEAMSDSPPNLSLLSSAPRSYDSTKDDYAVI